MDYSVPIFIGKVNGSTPLSSTIRTQFDGVYPTHFRGGLSSTNFLQMRRKQLKLHMKDSNGKSTMDYILATK